MAEYRLMEEKNIVKKFMTEVHSTNVLANCQRFDSFVEYLVGLCLS